MSNNSGLLVEMKNIYKHFPGVQALNDVSLSLRKGEVHAVLGENGAGKSTIMKVLAGIYSPDKGEIYLDGKKVVLNTPLDAINHGISMIHQELNLIPHMTIAENIFIGREETIKGLGIVKKQELIERTRKLFKEMDLDLDPKMQVWRLSVAEMQMVEIVKATSYNASVIIMDEPTSAITDREVDKLFEIIRKLKAKDKAIVYISHKLDEIFKIADYVSILRDGNYIDSKKITEIDKQQMISLMVGRDLKDMYVKEQSKIGETMLEVKGLTLPGKYKDVSFYIRKGEVLGIAGLMGAGRTEIAETLFGIRKPSSGEIIVRGKPVRIRNSREAMAHSIALVSEDRKLYGLNLLASVKFNVTIAYLKNYTYGSMVINKIKENKNVDEQIEALNIKTPTKETGVGSLSGGNQQKVVLAKWLVGDPDIIIMDEPTRGIDVGAKAEIYKIISALTQRGKSVIMISSELPELMGMSDRIVVMHAGRLTGEFDRCEFDQERVMVCATGHDKEGAAI